MGRSIKDEVRNLSVQLLAPLANSKQDIPRVRVLCFHDVVDESWFRSVITVITERYHVLTPEQFQQGEFDEQKVNVLVTFDDGFASWSEVAAPVLAEHQVLAVFFVSSGLLEAESAGVSEEFMREQLRIRPRKPLSWTAAKALAKQGHTIGAHTVTHQSLATLSAAEQKEEMLLDREKIATKQLPAPVMLAYPFGTRRDIGADTFRWGEEAGFMFQFSAESDWADIFQSSPIPRTLIDESVSLASLPAWIEGGYDIFRRLTIWNR